MTTEWRPEFAPHVRGRYEEAVVEDGERQPQRFECDCEKCGAHYQNVCTSGAVRTRIVRFAAVHLHRDPLEGAKR